METGVQWSLRKKLLLAGAFLVAVMIMVGPEDDPGVLQEIAGGSPGAGAQQPVAPPVAAPAAPAAPARVDSPELDSWYSEAGSTAQPAAPPTGTPQGPPADGGPSLGPPPPMQ